MNKRRLLLTSDGLSCDMKKLFFNIIGKEPEKAKILYIPTAGIATDSAREGIAICLHELSLMGIQYHNILVYNLELLLSENYQRTYSAYIEETLIITRLLTTEELKEFDAVVVSGGDSNVLCQEMRRTGFDRIIKQAIDSGLLYVGISAGSMYAAGNLNEGLHIINNSIIPHWNGSILTELPSDGSEICLANGQCIYVEGNNIYLKQ